MYNFSFIAYLLIWQFKDTRSVRSILKNQSKNCICLARTRGWFEPWPRTSWQGAKEPELAILKYEIILSFQSIWLILGKYDHLWFWVTGIWAPTFLVKVVTHKLYFSGVTAFSSLSADLRSRLKPPSGPKLSAICLVISRQSSGFRSSSL